MTPLPGLLALVPAAALLVGAVLARHFGVIAALIASSIAAAGGIALAAAPRGLESTLAWLQVGGSQAAVTLDSLDDALTRPFALLLVVLPFLASLGACARPRKRAVWKVLLVAGAGLIAVRASNWPGLAAGCALLSLSLVVAVGGSGSTEHRRQRAALAMIAAAVMLGAAAGANWPSQALSLRAATASWIAPFILPAALVVGLVLPGVLLLPAPRGSPRPADGYGGRFLIGVVTTTVAYVVARAWLTSGGVLAPTLASLLVIGGALVVVVGALGALSARRLPEILMLGMIGQAGYFVLALGFGGMVGATAATWEALAAGLIGPLLALAFRAPGIGVPLPRRVFAGAVPLRAVLIGVALASFAGLPATPSFWPRWLLLTAAIEDSRPFVAGILLIGWLLTIASLVRLTGGEVIRPNPLAPFLEGKGVRFQGERSTPLRLVPALLIGALTVVAGLAPAMVHADLVQPAVVAAWPALFVPAESAIAEIPARTVGIAISLFSLAGAAAIVLGRQLELSRDEEDTRVPERAAAWRSVTAAFEGGCSYAMAGSREVGAAVDEATRLLASRYFLPFVVVAAVVTLLVLLD